MANNQGFSELPERLDARRFAENGSQISGTLALAELPAVSARAESVHADAQVRVELYGGRKREGDVEILTLRGRFQTELTLRCQRCLELFSLPLTAETTLGLIDDEALADSLPESIEPLLLEAPLLLLAELVDNELLLELPLIPKHADASACGPLAKAIKTSEDANGRVKPFAGLSDLLKDLR